MPDLADLVNIANGLDLEFVDVFGEESLSLHQSEIISLWNDFEDGQKKRKLLEAWVGKVVQEAKAEPADLSAEEWEAAFREKKNALRRERLYSNIGYLKEFALYMIEMMDDEGDRKVFSELGRCDDIEEVRAQIKAYLRQSYQNALAAGETPDPLAHTDVVGDLRE